MLTSSSIETHPEASLKPFLGASITFVLSIVITLLLAL